MIRAEASEISDCSSARIDPFDYAVSLSECEGDLWICIA